MNSREDRPYVLVGVGFALYGIALFTQGTIRGRQEAGALGGEKHAMNWRAAALAAAGPVLGLAVRRSDSAAMRELAVCLTAQRARWVKPETL